jgi:hypothetical protein
MEEAVWLRGQRGATRQRGNHGGASELGSWLVAVVHVGALGG